MLGKLVDGNLIIGKGNVLKAHIEEVIQIPVVEVNEETGEETTTYREEAQVREYVVANPREEDWKNAGYKDVIESEPLEAREGYYPVPVYTDNGENIVVTYEYREIEEDASI